MATLAITIEEITKCLEMIRKSDDCEELLYEKKSKELLINNIQSKKVEFKKLQEGKKVELLEAEEKLKEVELDYSTKLSNYNDDKSTRDNSQSHYDTKYQEQESAREKLKSEENHEHNQRQKAIHAVDSSSAWYNVDNLNDLKSARDNNKKQGHVEDDYSKIRDGVNKCTYGYSPRIHTDCERKLNEKIAEFEKYHRYQADTKRAKEKLTEKETELSSAKTKLDQSKEALRLLEEQKDNAHTEFNVAKSKVERLKKELEQNEVNDEKKTLEDLTIYLKEQESELEQPEEPEIDKEAEENNELELVQETEMKAEL